MEQELNDKNKATGPALPAPPLLNGAASTAPRAALYLRVSTKADKRDGRKRHQNGPEQRP